MQLRISKHSDKPHTVLYRRDNGSETWMNADEFFVRHDLSHFALETRLGYTTAFMGMLREGMDLNDFTDRNKRAAMTLTDEAVQAENMANLFLMEHAQGRLEDFNEVLATSFNKMGTIAVPATLSDGELEDIRSMFSDLLKTWKEMPDGETMVLEF